ncbi:MAG: hypothetical protein R3B57_09140 [Phycisphaerales bacterium]
MRTNLKTSRGALLGASVLIAVAGAAAPALAGHGENNKPVAGREAVEVCVAEQTAGRLQIGGRSFKIGADYPLFDVVEAFKCMGYRASTDGKTVSVRVPGRNPAIAWSSDQYAAKFVVTADCIVVTLTPVDCAPEKWKEWQGHERSRGLPQGRPRFDEDRGGAPDWRSRGVPGASERESHERVGVREAPEVLTRVAARIGAFEVRIGQR